MFVSVCHQRDHIYETKERTNIDTDLHDCVTSLHENMVSTPQVIVYCQSTHWPCALICLLTSSMSWEKCSTSHLMCLKSTTVTYLVCFILHNTIKL